MQKRYILIGCLVAFLFPQIKANPAVEEILRSLTLEEKIGQLITIRSDAQGSPAYFQRIAEKIRRHNIGGVCFFRGTPHGLVHANNLFQSVSRIPLMISIDGEWGVSMRLDSVPRFPRKQTLGAVQNDHLIFEMGQLIGEQCNRLGIHVNFAPVVDVNSNPQNPVINTRAFGECRVNVANKGIAYMLGMQSRGVMASAKHFPGHGDTYLDSHYALPTITHSFERIDSIDLFPFKMLIRNGVQSVMIAHLNIPAMDGSRYPSTVSKALVDTLLRQQLGFDGLVFTDGLEMVGFTKFGLPDGEMELRALIAGNDVLLLPMNTERTIRHIANAVRSGRISEDLIDDRARRVLQAKYDLGILHSAPVISAENLIRDLNDPRFTDLIKRIYADAITVLENQNNILPINPEKHKRVANINIGNTNPNLFQRLVLGYSPNATTLNLSNAFEERRINSIVQQFSDYDLLIVSITNTNMHAARNYGVTQQTIRLIERLSALDIPMVLTIFASPYVLSSFPQNLSVEGLIIGYQYQQEALEVAAHGIFGNSDLRGRLPVTASERYPLFSGMPLKKKELTTVFNGMPKEVWSDPRFDAINERILQAISDSVFPGCQVLVAQNGEIIFHKAFGTHTYEDTTPVRLTDIYDVASISKIAATTLALMRLYDERKFKLDDRLSRHLPFLRNTNKSSITIRQVLAHHARLRPSVLTHRQDTLFNIERCEVFSIQVANGFYTSTAALDSVRRNVITSSLLSRREFRYSDLGFFLMGELVYALSGKPLDEYVEEYFFRPLELSRTAFRPTESFPLSQIIPTEYDSVFREQLVHGFVHDPTVAMLGGVGGSAGLFSNAADLFVIMQMLLNGGEFAGKQYISERTVDLFTQRIIRGNHRGAGFDKARVEERDRCLAAPSASSKSFGHTGFTGTIAWADPENQMVFIFLSNRVNPSAANPRMREQRFRQELMEMFYEVLMK